MAKEQYIVASSCRIDGQHMAKGSVIKLDIRNPQEGDKYHVLVRAGRLLAFSEQTLKEVKAEAEADERAAREAREDERAAKALQRKQRAAALATA